MRTSIRRWLASVGIAVGAGLSGAYAQTPPQPMPPKGGETVKPTVTPKSNPELLPPIPPLEEPTGLPVAGCNTCGDVNPNCADPGCAGALIPGPKEPVWMSYTQLLLWFQPARSPFPLAVGGPVGAPATVLLDGQRELGKFMAFKIDGGMWLNKDHTVGVGYDGFITEHRSNFQTVTSTGGTTIRRPFFDAVTGQQTFLIAADDGIPGSAATTVTARLASAGAHLRRNLRYDDTYQFDLFAGFRYYDLDESLIVFQRTTTPVAIPAVGVGAGGTVQLRDRVYTRNQFYGGELGGRFEMKHGMTFVAVTPKVAFGSIHQVTQISGETRGDGGPQQGALLASGVGTSGNLGRYVVNRFGLATDIGLQAGVALTKNSRIAVGYQFYYLNNVARPGNQFDQTINTRNVPVSPAFNSLTGVRAPQVTFDREGFYAHGASITMEARY